MDWKDNYTLLTTDCKKSPNNFRLLYYASLEESTKSKNDNLDFPERQQIYEQGLIHLKKSIDIYPGFSPAQNDLAYSFMQSNQLDSAVVHCKQELIINPDDEIALNNLAIVYIRQQRYNDGILLERKAHIVNPANSDYVGNIGVAYVKMDNTDSAIFYFRKAFFIDSTNITFIKYMVQIFNVAGQIDSAKKYESIVRLTDPTFKL